MNRAQIFAFSLGLTIGAVGVAAAATFGTAGADHLPACQNPIITYASVVTP